MSFADTFFQIKIWKSFQFSPASEMHFHVSCYCFSSLSLTSRPLINTQNFSMTFHERKIFSPRKFLLCRFKSKKGYFILLSCSHMKYIFEVSSWEHMRKWYSVYFPYSVVSWKCIFPKRSAFMVYFPFRILSQLFRQFFCFPPPFFSCSSSSLFF